MSPGASGSVGVIIIMGVSGAGKSTIGRLLGGTINWPFRDADDYHSPANKDKMHRGIALSDEDRRPWLEAMAQDISTTVKNGSRMVLACSALKHQYRQLLEEGLSTKEKERVKVVYLRADFAAIAERLNSRSDHFMNKNLLASQFETLEEPGEALIIDATLAPEKIVATIVGSLDLSQPESP